MKNLWIVILVLGFSSSSFAASKIDCNNDATYREVTKDELKKFVAEKSAFIVDVNSAETFAKNHVDGAIHYGKDFSKSLPADKNQLIVAYCGGPKCTAWKKAAKEACKAGHTNIAHFKGGISGWIQ